MHLRCHWARTTCMYSWTRDHCLIYKSRSRWFDAAIYFLIARSLQTNKRNTINWNKMCKYIWVNIQNYYMWMTWRWLILFSFSTIKYKQNNMYICMHIRYSFSFCHSDQLFVTIICDGMKICNMSYVFGMILIFVNILFGVCFLSTVCSCILKVRFAIF